MERGYKKGVKACRYIIFWILHLSNKSLTISKIVIMFISKKIMREKDFAYLKAKKPNYKAFRAPKESVKHKFQTLFKTPRGWFLSMIQEKKRVIGEISVPAAQEWLNECHIKYKTGW